MKKPLACFISVLMLLTVSACVSAPEDDELSETRHALNSADYILETESAPIYDKANFREEMSGSGEPTNYEELAEYIPAFKDTTLVGYEILSVYTPEEAVKITGKDNFEKSTTLYKAHIYYDYLNNVPLDITVDVAKAGMQEGVGQVKNNPPYLIGQKLISPLSGFGTESCIAIPDLVFYVYNVNGVDLAYHLDNGHIVLKDDTLPNLNMELFPEEYSAVTSTADNPAVFTQKSTVADLAEFFRRDWTERKYEFYKFS